MHEIIIGVIIVVILILAVKRYLPKPVVIPMPASPTWTRENNMDYTGGNVTPEGNGADGNVKYIGTYDTQDVCESNCGGNAWCHAYTWYDGNGGALANQCFGMSSIPNKAANGDAFSGQLAEKFDVRPLWNNGRNAWGRAKMAAGTFSNTLQRRLGMDGAGSSAAKEPFGTNNCVGTFDCMQGGALGEHFRSGSVYAGTMEEGYSHSAALPI